jgi:DNA-binding beta-propeller fold protein YncE
MTITRIAPLFIVALLPAAAQTDWAVGKTFPIGGEGSWDYLTVDPQTHRLYVPRSTHTMVIDAATGKTLADLAGQKTAHGVALVPEAGRGFISDGDRNGHAGIFVFDLKTNAILGFIPGEVDTDGIIYDPFTRQVLAVSGDKGILQTLKPDIDPKTGKLEAPIPLGGSPEFLAADGAGKAYINLMDKNEVAVVDIRARKVVARWPVAPGGAPVGMALDAGQKRLFIGCRKPQKLIVMSTESGKVLADLPIGAGVDAVKLDGGQAFASCGDGTLAVAAETAPGKWEIVQTVKTPEGARTMGIDSATHRIYLPTAEFTTGANGRRSAKPGTFMIVVVGR